jgi:hypothetical protein
MTDGLQIDDVVGLRSSFFQATVKRCPQRGLVLFDPAEHVCFENFLIRGHSHIAHILLEEPASQVNGGKAAVAHV